MSANKYQSGPVVSIGVPAFNESGRIAECISALVSQTYRNIEICISDNASTDGTFEILQRLASRYCNVRLARQERNIGSSRNFEAVRRMARGEYFMWLGADDRLLPTYVEKMVEQLEQNPRATAAHSASLRVDDKGQTLSEVRYGGNFNGSDIKPLRQAMLVLTPFKRYRRRKLNLYIYALYRRRVLDGIMTVLGNPPLDVGDRVLPMLTALSGGLLYVDEVLFVKHVHRRSFKRRAPEDPLHAARRRNASLSHLVHWVLICPTIPWWRRFHGVIVAAPFLLHRVQEVLRTAGLPGFVKSKFKF